MLTWKSVEIQLIVVAAALPIYYMLVTPLNALGLIYLIQQPYEVGVFIISFLQM